MLTPFENLFGNDESLDLARALVDLINLGVSHELFYGILG